MCKPFSQFLYGTYFNSNSELSIHNQSTYRVFFSSWFLRRVLLYFLLHTIIFFYQVSHFETANGIHYLLEPWPQGKNLSKPTILVRMQDMTIQDTIKRLGHWPVYLRMQKTRRQGLRLRSGWWQRRKASIENVGWRLRRGTQPRERNFRGDCARKSSYCANRGPDKGKVAVVYSQAWARILISWQLRNTIGSIPYMQITLT